MWLRLVDQCPDDLLVAAQGAGRVLAADDDRAVALDRAERARPVVVLVVLMDAVEVVLGRGRVVAAGRDQRRVVRARRHRRRPHAVPARPLAGRVHHLGRVLDPLVGAREHQAVRVAQQRHALHRVRLGGRLRGGARAPRAGPDGRASRPPRGCRRSAGAGGCAAPRVRAPGRPRARARRVRLLVGVLTHRGGGPPRRRASAPAARATPPERPPRPGSPRADARDRPARTAGR